jgi:hypothetical protein
LNQIENEFEFLHVTNEKQICELAQKLISEKATEKALGVLISMLK